jgi:hypothetical protein
MPFTRMPKPWISFNLASGELVTADRVVVGKPAPGKFITPVEIWVTPKTEPYCALTPCPAADEAFSRCCISASMLLAACTA